MYNTYNERLVDETNALQAELFEQVEKIKEVDGASVPGNLRVAQAICLQTLAILDANVGHVSRRL